MGDQAKDASKTSSWRTAILSKGYSIDKVTPNMGSHRNTEPRRSPLCKEEMVSIRYLVELPTRNEIPSRSKCMLANTTLAHRGRKTAYVDVQSCRSTLATGEAHRTETQSTTEVGKLVANTEARGPHPSNTQKKSRSVQAERNQQAKGTTTTARLL